MFRVLITDDEAMILRGMKNIIKWEELGLEIVDEASNGIEALKIIDSTKIHILITDIKMPKMDGLELIKEVKGKNLNIKCIILSGYDDFALVKEGARLGIENYLLKPLNVEELISTLSNTVKRIENDIYKQIEIDEGLNIIRNNVLVRWVNNDIGEDELLERSGILNLDLNTGGFQVAIVKILGVLTGNGSAAPDINTVNMICNEIIGKNKLRISFCDLSRDIVIIFRSEAVNGKTESIRSALQLVSKKISESFKIDTFVTIGDFEAKFQDTGKSYSAAKKLQEYCYIMPSNTIISCDDVTRRQLPAQNDLSSDLKILYECILSKDKVRSLEYIDKFYNRFDSAKELTPSHLRNLTIELLLTVIEAINKISKNPKIMFDNYSDIFHNVFEFKSLSDLKQSVTGIVFKCIDFLTSETEKINPVVKQVINYIDTNFSKEINLKTIASDFNISPAYLGYLFNKETGSTFTNYLNSVRVEKARELLLNTNLKANEVSEKVGYYNTGYFPIIFKKLTGMTPSEFSGKRGH